MTESETRYPGGKGVVYQQIINLMPPHRFYLETHVGGGAVIRNKRPAAVNVALDLDPKVRKRWAKGKFMHITFYQADALNYLAGVRRAKDVMIYCDPPYLLETRKSGKRKLYDYEYTEADHLNLLARLKELDPCRIIISGYWSDLYGHELQDWHHIQYEAMTRGGMATENLWFNYDPPTILHDYRYIGADYREREKIRRKQKRFIGKLERMDETERNAILNLIQTEFGGNHGRESEINIQTEKGQILS